MSTEILDAQDEEIAICGDADGDTGEEEGTAPGKKKRKKKPFIAAHHFTVGQVVTFPGNPGSGMAITGDVVEVEPVPGEMVRVFGTWNEAGDRNLFWLPARFCVRISEGNGAPTPTPTPAPTPPAPTPVHEAAQAKE